MLLVIFSALLSGCSASALTKPIGSTNSAASEGKSTKTEKSNGLEIVSFKVNQVDGKADDASGVVTVKNNLKKPVTITYLDFYLDTPSSKLPVSTFDQGTVTLEPNETFPIDLTFDANTQDEFGNVFQLEYDDPGVPKESYPISLPEVGYGVEVSTDDNSADSSPTGFGGITMEEFSQIDSSYTVDMVNKLFGLTGTLDSDIGQGTGYELTMYNWQDILGTIVTIQFQNGHEDAKSQVGL